MTTPLTANISLLFSEHPLLERPAAAAAAGFASIEAWWPFGPLATPPALEVASFIDAVISAEVQLTGLNLFAGDMPAGERGVLSQPGRADEFRGSLDVVETIARETGCRGFNALYGQRLPGLTAAEQDSRAIGSLALAVDRLGALGGRLFIEALADGPNGDYPLRTADEAMEVVLRARVATGGDSVGLLLDTFHLASNSEDLLSVIARYGEDIFHVQLADSPGRHEPGTGGIDFAAVLTALAEHGYEGGIAAEYAPSGETVAGLAWIDTLPLLRLGR